MQKEKIFYRLDNVLLNNMFSDIFKFLTIVPRTVIDFHITMNG